MVPICSRFTMKHTLTHTYRTFHVLAMPENANRTKNVLAMEAGKQSTVQCTFQTVNIVLILVQQRDDTFLLVQRLVTCNLYTVHRTLLRTLCTVHRTFLYTVHSAPYITPHSAQCTVHYSTLCTVHRTLLHTVHTPYCAPG